MKVDLRLAIALSVAAAIVILSLFLMRSNPPYTIEIRHKNADGTISYEPQDYNDWNHSSNIAGIRMHSKEIIYHSIYFAGVQYSFSQSHVFAMIGAENDSPSFLAKTWDYKGDPHDFPHYNYSQDCPHLGP